MNGAFALPQALKVNGTAVAGASNPTQLASWTGPVSNDPVTVHLMQSVAATDALRTGSYTKTLTFTLSTTTP